MDRRRQARQKAAGQLPDDEPVVEDNDSSQNPEELPGTRSKKQATAAAGSSTSTPSVTSQEYEIERILDIRVDEFQVQRVGYEKPTWGPATLTPPSSIEDFYRERFGRDPGTKWKR